MKLVFLLGVCANSIVDSFPYKYIVMFMITHFIKLHMGKLILNHLIGIDCPKFCSGLLDSYFFRLTLGSDCLELCFWLVGHLQNYPDSYYYKNTRYFQT